MSKRHEHDACPWPLPLPLSFPLPLNAITLNLSYYSLCTTFAWIGLGLWLKLIAHEVIEFHRTQVEGTGRGVRDRGRGRGGLLRVINEIGLALAAFASVSERLTWFMAHPLPCFPATPPPLPA